LCVVDNVPRSYWFFPAGILSGNLCHVTGSGTGGGTGGSGS